MILKNRILSIIISFLLISLCFQVIGDINFKNYEYTIIRDNYGIPHIFADTKEDLAFGVGYAVAEDRLWQMDLFRRQATGRLAEFGLAPLDYDYWIRQIGYSADENTELLSLMSPTYKNMIEAYIEGVNLYITEAIADPDNKMPLEYIERGLIPEPLTPEESLAIGQMMVRQWGAGGGSELFFLLALQVFIEQNGLIGGWKIFNDICPQIDPGSDTTLEWDSDSKLSLAAYNQPLYYLPLHRLARSIVERKEMVNVISESLGLLSYLGSNGWVVAPTKSVSGNAMLLGGPQMGHSIPQIVSEIGMHGAGINAVGMTFPGVGPFIAIGASERGAWTTTSGLSDGIDTYIEILHPLNQEKYLYNNRWYDMEKRIEIIYDSDGATNEFICYRTVHGPVLDFNWVSGKGGVAISQKMAFWKNEHLTIEGAMSFQECHNISEFEQGVSKIVSSHNWFWADRKGDVGYYHSGWYPIRPKYGLFHRTIDDRFPLIGTGKEEWQGIVPFEELPQDKNPPNGFYANWNNKPSPEWPYSEAEIGTMWGEGHGVVRIQELLNIKGTISFEYMIDTCRNVAYHHVYGTYFKPFLVEAIHSVIGVPTEIIELLENWDCYYDDVNDDGFYDDPGLTIFDAWYDEIFYTVLEDELTDEAKDYSHSLLLHVFQGDDSKLQLRYKDYLDGVARDTVIVDTLFNVLESLEERYATDNVSRWLTPVRTRGFSEEGSLDSPTMPRMNRGTYNQVIELPLWDSDDSRVLSNAVNVLPPGQSGFVNASGEENPHCYDQLDLYVNWQFKPMIFNITINQ